MSHGIPHSLSAFQVKIPIAKLSPPFFNSFSFFHVVMLLLQVFEHVVSDSARRKQYNLMAVVAYYGRHYITFCYHSVLKQWIYFDDAKFRKVCI